MIAEVWIPITHFEGFYDISNHGRVRTVARSVRHWRGGLRRLAARVLLPGKDGNGYCHYTLCKEGKTSIHKGHRLVAIHFIPNPDKLPEVNHIDLNRRN